MQTKNYIVVKSTDSLEEALHKIEDSEQVHRYSSNWCDSVEEAKALATKLDTASTKHKVVLYTQSVEEV